MNIQSITAKAWLFTIIFAILLGIQFIVQYLAQAQLKNDLSLLHKQQIILMHHAYALKEVTGKVHHEFIKINAFSGQDTLNESFENAEQHATTFTEIVNKLNNLNPENARDYTSLSTAFKEYVKTSMVMAEAYIEREPGSGLTLMEALEQDEVKVNNLVNKLVESTVQKVDESLKLTIHEADTDLNLLIAFSSLFIVLLASLIVANKLVLSAPLANLAQLIKSMAHQQRESGTINIDTRNLNKNMKTEIGLIAFWLTDLLDAIQKRHSETLLLANENYRIKQALDACSTNVMIADANFNIVYMNPAVQNMMKVAESDLQKDLPKFVANQLMGQNIDAFHKHPGHQRSLLEKLSATYKTIIKVGSRTFGLIATPIIDDQNNRLGTVVEWTDKTAEVHIEKEVDSLIQAANSGDLSKRINTHDQNGFVATLSSGLNELMDKVSCFVNDVGAVFEAMSEGNLTKQISNPYQGELEVIKDNANNSIAKLNTVLSEIHNASSIVKTSANEVAQGSDDLSRRTEAQASSLEETAASMEEITATVKQTADNATQSNILASEAKLKAQKGGEVVQGAVIAMNEIMDSSNKINDIIGVIDEIAFQTNLLALNAAVEAARAGDQGRGFAVVAGEVRSLSQRSASAAKEIKDLIRDSVSKVKSGSNSVNKSGQMLSEIVQSVEKVAQMISDVNNAAAEQNAGIRQINQAITQMDEMTQQNAALVEETSAASRSMSEEANNMNRLISFFQITQQTISPDLPTNKSNLHKKTGIPNSKSDTAAQTKFTPNTGASFSSDDNWEDF